MKKSWLSATSLVIVAIAVLVVACAVAGDGPEGSLSYGDFESDDVCGECHGDIARQHAQAMMSQSFTHHWDEIEYFELALPHALKEEKVAGVKAGCNGCHAPLALLAGDIPPKRPAENSRANEGVSCDVCHSITGFEGEVPFNFNFVIEPGEANLTFLEFDFPDIDDVIPFGPGTFSNHISSYSRGKLKVDWVEQGNDHFDFFFK